MLKTNTTLTLLDLSDNEIGMWSEGDKRYVGYKEHPTPEGPAALADGLKSNSTVQQLDVSSNGLDRASKGRLTEAKPLQLRALKL